MGLRLLISVDEMVDEEVATSPIGLSLVVGGTYLPGNW